MNIAAIMEKFHRNLIFFTGEQLLQYLNKHQLNNLINSKILIIIGGKNFHKQEEVKDLKETSEFITNCSFSGTKVYQKSQQLFSNEKLPIVAASQRLLLVSFT